VDPLQNIPCSPPSRGRAFSESVSPEPIEDIPLFISQKSPISKNQEHSPTSPPLILLPQPSKSQNNLVLKYIVSRTEPETPTEIIKTLCEFLDDLESQIPQQKPILGYMKKIALKLNHESTQESENLLQNNLIDPLIRKTTEPTQTIVCEDYETKKQKSETSIKSVISNKRWFRYNENNPNQEKIINKRLIHMSQHFGSMRNIYANPEKNENTEKLDKPDLKIMPIKSGPLKPNLIVSHNHTGSYDISSKIAIPKLDLGAAEKLGKNKGYMDEFMEKFDEFSMSWREDAKIMKTVAAEHNENINKNDE